jgi:thiol-disulfide isomerase/thioredoxin
MRKVTATAFPEFIATGARIVVVTAAWAGHSRSFIPVVEEIERELDEHCRLALLDSDAEPELTDTLTKAVPSTHVFIDGKQVHSIIGAVSADELRSELSQAGIHFARTSAIKPGLMGGPRNRLALTQDFVARANVAALADRDGLAACIRHSSWIATYGSTAEVEVSIDSALAAIRELPVLIAEVEAAALDQERRAVYRLGAMAGLLYGAATFDGLADMLPASYGYLDDWLVLRATKCVYVEAPEASEHAALARHSMLVWKCLPPRVIPPLMQFVGYMEDERTLLQQLPELQVRALLDGHLKRPAPMQFVVPARQATTPPRDPMAGWTTNASGSHWSDGEPITLHDRRTVA